MDTAAGTAEATGIADVTSDVNDARARHHAMMTPAARAYRAPHEPIPQKLTGSHGYCHGHWHTRRSATQSPLRHRLWRLPPHKPGPRVEPTRGLRIEIAPRPQPLSAAIRVGAGRIELPTPTVSR